jgi:hypothetical protein
LLADNRRAWEMHSDGTYQQCRPGDEAVIDTQARFMERALADEPEADDPAAVDLEGPLAPDPEEVGEPIHLPEEFVEPSLEEVIRSSDVAPDPVTEPAESTEAHGGTADEPTDNSSVDESDDDTAESASENDDDSETSEHDQDERADADARSAGDWDAAGTAEHQSTEKADREDASEGGDGEADDGENTEEPSRRSDGSGDSILPDWLS